MVDFQALIIYILISSTTYHFIVSFPITPAHTESLGTVCLKTLFGSHFLLRPNKNG